jgi:hypothetical protein
MIVTKLVALHHLHSTCLPSFCIPPRSKEHQKKENLNMMPDDPVNEGISLWSIGQSQTEWTTMVEVL